MFSCWGGGYETRCTWGQIEDKSVHDFFKILIKRLICVGYASKLIIIVLSHILCKSRVAQMVDGVQSGDRTRNFQIKSPMQYHLCYLNEVTTLLSLPNLVCLQMLYYTTNMQPLFYNACFLF